jgi:hypothetical protein
MQESAVIRVRPRIVYNVGQSDFPRKGRDALVIIETVFGLDAFDSPHIPVLVRPEFLILPFQRSTQKNASGVQVEPLGNPFVHLGNSQPTAGGFCFCLDAEMLFEPFLSFHHNAAGIRAAQVERDFIGLFMGQGCQESLSVFH